VQYACIAAWPEGNERQEYKIRQWGQTSISSQPIMDNILPAFRLVSDRYSGWTLTLGSSEYTLLRVRRLLGLETCMFQQAINVQ
jgi:hypothetical protein